MPLTVATEKSPMLYQRLTGVLLVLMLAGCVAAVVVPAGIGWDFANFYDTGRRVAAGQMADLYHPETLIDGEQPQGKLRFWGTPISAYLYAPMSRFSPETALMLFKIQNVLAYFAAFGVLFLLCRTFIPPFRSARWEFAAVFAFLCLLYQPFWTIFRVGGQTTPTIFLLLTLALLFHTHARFWGSALCIVLATLIKPALAPALLFLLCVSGLRFFRSTVVVLGVVGLASLALLGWAIHFEFLTLMLGGVRVTYPWYYNSSLYILFENLRTAAGPEAQTGLYNLLFTVSTYALKAGVLGTFVYVTVKSRARAWPDAARRHFDVLMATAFFLLFSQTLWEHYLTVLFLLLTYVVANHQHFSRGALALVAAIFVLSFGQNLIFIHFLQTRFAFESVYALLGIALFKSGPLLLTLIFLWRHYRELFHSYTTPAWTEALPLRWSRM